MRSIIQSLGQVGGRLSIRLIAALVLALLAGQGSGRVAVYAQSGGCASPANAVVAENCLAGSTDWDLTAGNDPTIQGYASQISVNRGETVLFKIDTAATAYRIDIYRLGYYGGAGARKITTTNMALSARQVQPACLNDFATGLIDCGNWATSASWDTTGQTSGIYLAKLTRTDGFAEGASHMVFIVRDDARPSALVFQTSDTTWQAYNRYGGNSLYLGGPATSPSYYASPGRAYKVSYNRPFDTRDNNPGSWLFNAEYPMVRWLEANGYDVSYLTGVDSDRSAALIKNHRAFLSVGHDEYWSGTQRANVEAARDAGVHLAFFSGNEVYWKTRWEASIDGTNTARRTLVSYKESLNNAKIDPSPVWTGTWRDPAFSPPSDGGRPENALTGTVWTVNCCSYPLRVPAEMGKQRFWRNTSVAALPPGGFANLVTSNLLGYEWDEDLDNGFRPAGLTRLSSTTVDVPERLVDNSALTAPGTATHALTLYRTHTVDSLGNPKSALVFGAGTVQWSWGLDGSHDRGASTPDPNLQQATVNLLADMGAQPGSIQAGLASAAASTDTTAPVATVVSPAAGATVENGVRLTIQGTATDTGGIVGGVEVSLDGGASWHPATGQSNWSYLWTPAVTGSVNILARATDDSGNVGTPSGVSITVGATSCPCSSLWNHDVTVPATVDGGDASAVEVGVKFTSDIDGFITGVRFYKSSLNTGTHIGHLWTSTGTLLATATFTGESSVGWQQVRFGAPVAILAHQTYVASYHTNVGHYSADQPYFALGPVNSPPLHAPATGNGVFTYGMSAFPTTTFRFSNYWVDVDFAESVTDTTDLVISHINAAALDGTRAVISWTTNKEADSRVDYSIIPTLPPAQTASVTDGALVNQHRVILTGLIPNSTYYFRLTSVDSSGNAAVTLAPNFTVPGPTLHDTASIDFLAGTLDAGIAVSETDDGEVILKPTAGAEFSGDSLPPGWTGLLWNPGSGGSFSLADGDLLVDGARVGTCDATAVPDCESGIYGPGHSLEFAATFSGDPFQHAGFGIKFEDQTPRAVFTTDAGGTFKTRTTDGSGASIVTDLGTAYLGFPHRFRIDWTTTGVNFSVDGALVATHPAVIPGPMRPIAASDYNPLGGNVVVDWMRMSPYAASGTFVSRVFDAQGPVDWASIFWTGDTPLGTSLAVSVRTGDTATPNDGTWSAFAPVSVPGDFPGPSSHSRYVQYSVALTSTDPTITPQLQDIIISTDHAPVAVDDAASTATNTPYTFAAAGPSSLKANDSDVDSPFVQLRVISVSAAANGAATLNSNGSVTYTPLAGFTGTDGFTYTISDGLLSSIADVTMTVGGPPTANPDSFTVNENSGVNTLSVLANDSQVASGALTITSVTQGAHGAVAIVPGGTAVTYAPAANFFGADSFSYTITDGLGGTASAAVAVTVTNVNGAPSLAAIGSKSVAENALLAFTLSATDPDGDPVTYSATGLPSGATLDASTGAFSWTPSFSQAGSYPVTFKASDNGSPALSASEAITITVTNVNRAPVLTPIGNKSGASATLLTFTVSATDADGDALTFGTTVLPAGATFNAVSHTFSWTPTSSQGGSYPVTFTASDNGSPALSASEAITIVISNSNHPPVLAAIGNKSVAENALLAFTLSATDPDGNAVSFSATGLPSGATLMSATGAFSWTPSFSQAGSYVVMFTATDNGSPVLSVSQTITITVTNTNRAPVAAAQSVTTAEDTSKAITLAGTDADGNALTFAVVTPPAHGTLTGTAPNLSYKPALNYYANDSFTFKVNDGTVDSTPATVSLTITAVNDPPVANPQSVTAPMNAPKAIILTGSDVEGHALTYSVVTKPGHGTLSGTAPNLTYTPVSGYIGGDSFTFKVSDGTVDSAVAIVGITVTKQPTLTISNASVVEGTCRFALCTRMNNPPFTVTLSAASTQTVTVHYATMNGSAMAPKDYAAQSGTLTFAPGERSKTITVMVVGDNTREHNESMTVRLSSPTNATIARTDGTGTIIDDDARPHFMVSSVSVVEGNLGQKFLVFAVQPTNANSEIVSVDFTTIAGAFAREGIDFLPMSGTLTFAAESTAPQFVSVPIFGNLRHQKLHKVFLRLRNAVEADLDGVDTAGDINDDDPIPAMKVSDVTIGEPTTGTVNAVINVTLSNDSDDAVTVNYSTANGTAVAGVDYVAGSGTLTFQPGVTVQPVTIRINAANSFTGTETFYVNLTNPVNATIADASGLVTLNTPGAWSNSATADFSAGTPGTGGYVSETANGELMLAPTVATEFSGTALPAGWINTVIASGGSSKVANGSVFVNGASLIAPTTYGPGRTLEFVASFSGSRIQNAGFGMTSALLPPFAMFGVKADGKLYARSMALQLIETQIAGSWFTGPHRFRIDWNATNVVYWVDGTQVANHTLAFSGILAAMRPAITDLSASGGVIAVDWMRMTAYASSGTYLSSIYNAGAAVTWLQASWLADQPTGTGVTVEVRTGTTATPDSTWTAFRALASGATVGGTSRYAQYRVTLSTTVANVSPTLKEIVITFAR